MMFRKSLGFAVVVGVLACAATTRAEDWKGQLANELPRLGHRNWICVVDSAYPSQTAPGVKLIYAGGDHLQVLEHVLKTIDSAKHVRGVVHVDQELPLVSDKHAPGMASFRDKMLQQLKGRDIVEMPHAKIIENVDEFGKSFNILMIKTDLTLPYTSVFIRLDAGYWSDEAEADLRQRMESK
jgi:L-fucose mutarotase/ribose pyranase (RbsD/FucU family)